jgi:arylsulfatase A-like enzyme
MLLTGAYPWHNGVYHQVHVPMSLNPDMAPDVTTYSQILRGSGYRAGYVGKWHASRMRGPLDFGYEFWRAPIQACLTGEAKKRHQLEGAPATLRNKDLPYALADKKEVTWPGGDRFVMWGSVQGVFEATQEYFIAKQAEEAIDEFGGQSEPWLLEVHFPEPHDPYKPLKDILATYPEEKIELPDNYTRETFADKPNLLRREASLWSELTDEDFRQGLRHYYAYCEQLDRAVGVVVDALERSGQADRTLVVCSSDHGDSVGSHRVFIKGWTPYEETYRLPMVARWPGVIPSASRTDALVQLHDWAHTFLAVAGAESLPYADGKDLTPLLQEPSRAEAGWPGFILNCYYGCELLYVQRMVVGKRFKYVFNGFDWDEMYDLVEDPGELVNLAENPAYSEAAQDMRDALWELMFRCHDPYTTLRWGAARYLKGPRNGQPQRPWLDVYLRDPDHPDVTKTGFSEKNRDIG